MKWWYTPQNGELYKWDDFEDVVFSIASMCRFQREKHVVPNYYIYNDNGLVDIVKGSELDLLSYLRTSDEKDGNLLATESNYYEGYENPGEEFERLMDIVRRDYSRSSEQLREDKNEIERIKEVVRRKYRMETILDKKVINEYKMKYTHGDVATAYVSDSCQISTYKLASEVDRDMRNIPIILNEIYELNKVTEEHAFVFAYQSENLIGYSLISHGTINTCDMDAKVIFRFLLLVGATDFVIVHNHPLGKPEMSQQDYDITKSLLEASDFMNINMLEHIIIGKNDWDGILMQIQEMDADGYENVRDYYRSLKE